MATRKRSTGKIYTADQWEERETLELLKELRAEESAEDSRWKIRTDTAAFGREKIPIPERWE